MTLLIEHATLSLGRRTLWRALSLDLAPGEVLAVLGPNGAGKSSLLRAILGQVALQEGSITVDGPVGLIPQQRGFDPATPLRGRDLVRLGLDGHRWGWSRPDLRRVDAAIDQVGASAFAARPVGLLSGGEQQRLRVAQAIVGSPALLLCDEPLLSLDLHHQQAITGLIDAHRRASRTAVVFVTHELTPVLPIVDRVLLLVDGRWALGPVDEVMTTGVLSDLYGTEVEVLRHRGRLVVVGAPEAGH